MVNDRFTIMLILLYGFLVTKSNNQMKQSNFISKWMNIFSTHSRLNKHVVKLALPVLFGMLSHTMIQVTDTLMVGALGYQAIAAAGLGGITYFTLLSFLMNGAIGVQIITARRYGEKEFTEIGKILSTVFYFCIVSGLVLTLAGYYTSPYYIELLSEDAEIIQSSSSYLAYRFLGTFFFLMGFGFRGFLDGLGYTIAGMVSAISTMLANIFLNWLLIFGNWNFPKMGLDGAGLASSLAGLFGLLVFFIFLFKKEIRQYVKFSGLKPSFHILKEIVYVGFPPAVDGALTNLAFLIFNKLAGIIGVVSVASTTIIVSIASVSFMPGFAFGVAATTILGQAVGAGNYKKAYMGTYRSAHYSALIMGSMGVLFILLGKFLISFFAKEQIVIEDAYPALVILSLAQVGDAYHMVIGSALRSAGLVYWVMVVYFLSSYLVMIPVAYFFGIVMGYGTTGLWLSISIWLVVLCLSFLYKFEKGDWKNVKV
jgi:multidrug resistance protein, MATE family